MLYVLALLVYILDQGVKLYVRTHLALGQTVPVWPGVFVIEYIRNPGAAWGMLAHARGLLIAVALFVCAAVVYVERKYRLTWPATIGLALILGGALGNLTDRASTGTVVDFLYIEAIRFPVFNLADTAVCCGVALLLWRSLRAQPERPGWRGQHASVDAAPDAGVARNQPNGS
ncbi:MAG: signal peptidase II, partial [Alicyclobacillus sp.]|nr:signal peptidase II [Alicyclobacillus sp.]